VSRLQLDLQSLYGLVKTMITKKPVECETPVWPQSAMPLNSLARVSRKWHNGSIKRHQQVFFCFWSGVLVAVSSRETMPLRSRWGNVYTACLQPHNPSCCIGRLVPTAGSVGYVTSGSYLWPLVLSAPLSTLGSHTGSLIPHVLYLDTINCSETSTCSGRQAVEVAMSCTGIRQVNYGSRSRAFFETE
jgi:hypothetical protein